MTLDSFPNAKSKLLGEGEDSVGIIDTPAVAGLSGDSSLVVDAVASGASNGNTINFENVDNRFRIFVNDDTIVSASVTVPGTDSVVVIMMANEQGNAGGEVKIRNITTSQDIGGNIDLDSGGSGGIALNSAMVVDETPAAGSNTYSVISIGSNSIFQLDIRVQVIVLDDTHAGIITTPATATKQINTPDSHTTHEQGELPA